MNPTLLSIRHAMDTANLRNESDAVNELRAQAALSLADREAIVAKAADLVREIRGQNKLGLMEVFLAEYGLGTEEGLALMSMAEALLRVPDSATADALISDKIAPADWAAHKGNSASALVNTATFGLMLTSAVLDAPQKSAIRGAIKRLGAPVIRHCVGLAMREMGKQFVLGETIESALKNAQKAEERGFTYSYDMLGEAARTSKDADKYFRDYSTAIAAIAKRCVHGSIAANPGISIKLSALHPRYEVAQSARVMEELVPRVLQLCLDAKAANMGLNIDAEEADRLQLSLDVIEAVLSSPELAGWDGFGVVVQAYGKRAGLAIDWLYTLAQTLDRKIMLRLVKGAYWDAEIKRVQVEGLAGFPVYTQKYQTDISYISNARKLLGLTDRIYPQFAGHNAHTVSAIRHMAEEMGISADQWEFQRLHGMGESLHSILRSSLGTHCRIYAPVGAHVDLLAYLVRRLLENGANSSFVNQIVDESLAPETVVTDPFGPQPPAFDIAAGPALFGEGRVNAKGFDLTDFPTLQAIEDARAPFATHSWSAAPILASNNISQGVSAPVLNPAEAASIGQGQEADLASVEEAFASAETWQADAAERAATLRRAADLYEENFGEIFALLAREAGKIQADAVAELREAVDFLRYYASEAQRQPDLSARGIWACISPWNFPLAIFSGQIAAALASGNAVLAKPAPQTPFIASLAVQLLHQAGVPRSALQLLPGGAEVGAALTASPKLAGVAFTGSTATAKHIRQSLSQNAKPGTPLIAETGGLNAMIVDSTALPEAAVRDVINAAFRSAGQRCSALRCLYIQEDIAPKVIEMIKGAMEELVLGNPWELTTDVGPLIDGSAQASIQDYLAQNATRILHQVDAPKTGFFLPPTLLGVAGIEDLEREIFGPVLHVATFKAAELDQIVAKINASGFGLTFGLHTRLQARVDKLSKAVHAGNIYVNRNQIGAVVGSQPFGGEGLSGTGPKAGGPNYLPRFAAPSEKTPPLSRQIELPGPTGELNRLMLIERGPILCLGPSEAEQRTQCSAVEALGGKAMIGKLSDVSHPAIAGVLYWANDEQAQRIEQTLAERDGPILPLIPSWPDLGHIYHERHLCVDTTAAGGNAQLLAQSSKRRA